jgi:hypothetical protein
MKSGKVFLPVFLKLVATNAKSFCGMLSTCATSEEPKKKT